jgi:glycosyltransferase involved in cell wall biosynthesis
VGTNEIGQSGRFDVVFYSPWITPLLATTDEASTGGAETQVYLIARALAKRGRSVGIVALEDGSPLPKVVDGVRVIGRPPWTGDKGFRGKFTEVFTLARTLLRLDTAVFVQRAAGVTTGLVALVARTKRRRFVYSSANVIDFDYQDLEPSRTNLGLYHLGVRLADEIVVQTEEQETLCRQRFGRSPSVIKSIAQPSGRDKIPGEALLWIGRLAFYKRPLAFIELARRLPEARFQMIGVEARAGGSALGREVERAARELPNLELLPSCPRSELVRLMESAVAVVNTADYEGMPNVFLEGWSLGVPALALSHDPGGVIEREGLGGFARGSAEQFLTLALELWETRGQQDHIAERCRAYVRREHSPEAIASEWEAVLRLDPRDIGGALGSAS